MNKFKLDFVNPITLNPHAATAKEVADSVIWQHKRYGVRRFAYFAPSKGWRGTGYPPREEYIKCAEMAAQVKKLTEGYDVEFGWFMALTIKSGHSDEFVSPVRKDGTIHPFSSCPLDPVFRKRFSEDAALFVKIAKPSFVFTEDDYSTSAVNGCFCGNHLSEFAKRAGRYYSREELVKILHDSSNTDNLEIVKKWRELSRDTLVDMAKCIREEIDKVAPETQIGYMQAGGADYDGDVTEAVSRALAGGRHTPFSRLHGAFYGGANVKRLPEMLYHALYTKQHTGENFRFYHECDPFPHNKFFTAGKHMKAITGTVCSYGFDGGIYFMSGFSLNENSTETIYGDVYAEESKRFLEVSRIAKKCTLKGVQLDYDPFWNTFDDTYSTQNPLWAKCISRFGIPYTTEDSSVAFWDVRQAKYSDHAKIMERLSKGLILDGDAARALCERGYSEYIGVSVGDDVSKGMLSYDLGAYEKVTEKYEPKNGSIRMPCAHMFSPSGRGKWLKLDITDSKCEIVSEAYTFFSDLITPAMTFFENSLGGKVAVMSLTLNGNNSQALYNYDRMETLQKLISLCSDEYVYANNIPEMNIIVNEATDANADFTGMITMINLYEDKINKAELHLPEKWKKAERIRVLDKDAVWHDIPFEKTADGVVISTEFEYCEPVYILFS